MKNSYQYLQKILNYTNTQYKGVHTFAYLILNYWNSGKLKIENWQTSFSKINKYSAKKVYDYYHLYFIVVEITKFMYIWFFFCKYPKT